MHFDLDASRSFTLLAGLSKRFGGFGGSFIALHRWGAGSKLRITSLKFTDTQLAIESAVGQREELRPPVGVRRWCLTSLVRKLGETSRLRLMIECAPRTLLMRCGTLYKQIRISSSQSSG